MAGLNKLQLQVWGRKKETKVIPTFSGFNIIELWGFFKTSETIIDYPLRVVGNTTVGGDYAVFWDENNVISGSSKISALNGTTPSANDLDSLTSGNSYIAVTQLISHTTGKVLSRTDSVSNTGVIWRTGGYMKVNGELALYIDPSNICRFDGTPLASINGGQNWTLSTFSKPTGYIGLEALFCTSATRGRNFRMFSNINNLLLATFHRDTNVLYNLNYSSASASTDSRRLVITLTNNQMKGYYNSVLQNNLAVAGAYYNDNVRFFGVSSTSGPFEGYWQMTAIHNTTQTQTQVDDLDNQIKIFFEL